ncbi:hypothetical protein GCM10008941_37000 [Rhizomicrobium palustre]
MFVGKSGVVMHAAKIRYDPGQAKMKTRHKKKRAPESGNPVGPCFASRTMGGSAGFKSYVFLTNQGGASLAALPAICVGADYAV